MRSVYGCILIVGSLLMIVNCGGPPKVDATGRTVRIPIAVVMEREISGKILGHPLQNPVGLAVGQRNTVYLVDSGNNRVIKLDSNLAPVHERGGYGRQPGLFDRPSFVTVDNDLNVWVSDVGNQRICRLNSRLEYVDEITFFDDSDALKFREPSGIAFTAFGEAWVCDREQDRIAIYDNIGRFDRFAGEFGYSGGQLYSPEKIILTPADSFLVCDAGNNRMAVYDEYGNYIREVYDKSFGYLKGVAIDDNGLIWLLDSDSRSLICLNAAGDRLMTAGPTIPGCPQAMKDPSDIVFTRNGHLLISDSGNNRLLVCRVIYDSQ